MYHKMNITLSDQTAHLLEQLTDRMSKKRFIEDAVKYYIDHIGKSKIREQLKQGAMERAGRDLKLSHEWDSLEDKIW
ncbi:MAG: CopG family transcriptional regulator [Candidatus Electronema aureum]|uniref:CopG family transcriptional regulator n=1 Tax=Candidatus Electronema aureum TaxID=2005002 RepID=A0A521FYY9_9BACT|nr:MAG: CopG family transcriptional regulator [Candidatus Electronema aureum]